MSRIIFIGVGNRFRSDDAAGLHILDKLQSGGFANAEFLEASGEGAALIEMMAGRDRVYIFDAVSSGAKAGTIFRFDATQETIPAKFFNYSTHAFSLAESIEMARILGKLPRSLIVYGIEGKNFGAGVLLCEDVATAIAEVIEQVRDELKV